MHRLFALLCLSLCATACLPQSSRSDPQADFEAFWSLYDKRYALFGVKHVDWDAVYKVYRPKVTAKTSRVELFQIFGEIIRLLNDVHAEVEDQRTGRTIRSGGRSIGTGPFDIGVFSHDLIESAYARKGLKRRAGNVFRFGWLSGDIGYVHIRAFRRRSASVRAIDEVVETFENARAIVIDVRQNSGGDDRIGRLIANRFASKRRLYMTVAARLRGSGRRAFGKPVEWYVEPAGPKQFQGPIMVLTNSRSISAAENFVLAMRAIPRALIVGETTAGVMADAITEEIGDDWEFSVAINLFRDAQGVSWEGIGLVPDLWVTNNKTDIASGSDRVLDVALSFAGKTVAPGRRLRVVPR
ncbi:MAG: S41 family peptidase [Hyphomicrobiaceae bacterium]